MIRIVVSGHGVRGRQWAGAISANPNAEVAAIVDVNAAAEVPGISFYADLASALDGERADAVLLATPPEYHARDVLTAVERGLPVLCEKPLTEDLAEAVSLVEAVDRASGTLLVGMNFRFLPVSGRVRQLVTSRELGNVMFGQFTYIRNRDGRRTDLNDYPLEMIQPMLVEQSIHHLDLLRHVYDREVLSVAADTWNPGPSVYVGDSCVAALLRFEGGLHVSYLGTWTSGSNRFDFRWRTDFEGGIAVQSDQFGMLSTSRLVDGAARTNALFAGDAEPLQEVPVPMSMVPFELDTARLLTHFLRVVQGEEESGPTGRDHLRTLALVHACMEATTTGRFIDIAGFARTNSIPLHA
jgi:myo-inositol 2-dehydrogenase / D-chiro-inositol 1-dehydrogenase